MQQQPPAKSHLRSYVYMLPSVPYMCHTLLMMMSPQGFMVNGKTFGRLSPLLQEATVYPPGCVPKTRTRPNRYGLSGLVPADENLGESKL